MLPATLDAARRFIAAATLLLVVDASAQASAKLPRVGFCSPGIPQASLVNLDHPIPRFLLAAMRERGWQDGKNYSLVFRTGQGRAGGYQACIDTLIDDAVDVIVLPIPGIESILKRTREIPIVAQINRRDAAYLASLPPSKRTVTGVTRESSSETWRKQLAIFREATHVDRIVVLVPRQPDQPDTTPGLQQQKSSGWSEDERHVGIPIDRWIVTNVEQVEPACASIARMGRVGLYVVNSPNWVTWLWRHPRNSTWVGDFCAYPHNLPVMGEESSGVGGPGILMAYGPGFRDYLRRVPYFVDRILKGARASDLPLQQLDDYPLAVNLAVARRIGLTIPPAILLRAELVFEQEDDKGSLSPFTAKDRY